MIRTQKLAILTLLSVASVASAGPVWTQVWSDEFNAAANAGLNTTWWNVETGGGGWGNNELQTYTNRTQNIRHNGVGQLIIEARAENYTGGDGINRNYTSGRFQSNGKFTQAYGRFEALVKIPIGQGVWPAFWMMGNNIGSQGWPTCGEIDIMEVLGHAPDIAYGTIHGPGYSGAGGIGLSYNAGSSLANGYHLYAVEWEPNIIRWYIDNNLYEVRTTADLPGGSAWVFDHPFFMLFNVAVGGNWPGSPNGSTTFPQQMLVDYVRVYSKNTTQTPLNSVLPIPGTIQCEDYDNGGEGVAFHDVSPENSGGLNAPRRAEAVDLEACTDAGGGSSLGWTVAGEWLEYSVNIAAAGNYEFRARVASQGAGGTFHLQLNAGDIAGSGMTVPDTGGWQNWQTLGPLTISLPAGQHVLQLKMDTNGGTGGIGNFNWLSFASLVPPTATRTRTPQASATRTAPPSATQSATSTPSRTVTNTLTVTPTFTRTVTPSRTSSATSSASPTTTVSPSITATVTDVPVGSSATHTPSISPTASHTATVTASSSATVTAQDSATSTETAVSSPSATPSSSGTSTSTVTSPPTALATGTFTSTRTPSPTTTSTPVDSPTAAPTLIPRGGLGRVKKVVAVPNPSSGPHLRVALHLDAPSDEVEFRLFSTAMTCLRKERLQGPFPGGWSQASVDVAALPSGLYFVTAGDARARVLLLK